MAKINGTLVLFDLDGDELAHVDNATWNSSFSPADAADKQSGGYQEYLEEAGLREASIDIDGNATFGAGGNVEQLAEAIQSRQNLPFVFGPETGGLQFTGQCLINDHSISAPNEGTTTFTAVASVNGPWTIDQAGA